MAMLGRRGDTGMPAGGGAERVTCISIEQSSTYSFIFCFVFFVWLVILVVCVHVLICVVPFERCT